MVDPLYLASAFLYIEKDKGQENDDGRRTFFDASSYDSHHHLPSSSPPPYHHHHHHHIQIKNSYKTYGSVFTVNLLTQRMTFLLGPEAAAAFFKATDKDLGQDEVYR